MWTNPSDSKCDPSGLRYVAHLACFVDITAKANLGSRDSYNDKGMPIACNITASGNFSQEIALDSLFFRVGFLGSQDGLYNEEYV